MDSAKPGASLWVLILAAWTPDWYRQADMEELIGCPESQRCWIVVDSQALRRANDGWADRWRVFVVWRDAGSETPGRLSRAILPLAGKPLGMSSLEP